MSQSHRTSLRKRLAAHDHTRVWLDELDAIGPSSTGLRIPGPDEATDVLAKLATPHGEIAEIVATLPSPAGDLERWRLLEAAHHRLTVGLGDDEDARPSRDGHGPWGAWPTFPPTAPVEDRLFYVHLFLIAVPDIRRWHEAHGIDDDVSWATLANVGRNIGLHRTKHGVSGIDAPWWLILHFRGALFHVGRLQYRRGTTWWTDADIDSAGASFRAGDRVLDLHIPPTGPLTPDAVEASFGRARAFFQRHFPVEDSPNGVCTSWLLDPQLADYLPAASNIVRFQRRFHLVPGWEMDGTASVIEFVFRRAEPRLDGLPQDTTLQRAVVSHVRRGRRWRTCRGWCVVDAH